MIQSRMYIIVAAILLLSDTTSGLLRKSNSRRELAIEDANLSDKIEGLRESLHKQHEETETATAPKETEEQSRESMLNELLSLETKLQEALKSSDEADVSATDAETEKTAGEAKKAEAKTSETPAESTSVSKETEVKETAPDISYLHDEVACGDLGNYLRKSVHDCELSCYETKGCKSFSFSLLNMGRCLLCSTPTPKYKAILPGVTFGTFDSMALSLAESEQEEACGEVGGCTHFWQPCGFTFIPFQKVDGTNYYQDSSASFAKLAKKCRADGDNCRGFSSDGWLFSSEDELSTEAGECIGVFVKELEEEEEGKH